MFSVNEGISILLKDKKVVLSQSWLFLNDKKNEGQNNIGYRKLEKFLEKEHWEKIFARGQDFFFFKIGFNFN